MVNKLNKIKNFVPALIEKAASVIDIRDILVYGGLISIGYGFYQLFPWLGWVVFGVLSMLLGLGWLFRVPRGIS